MQLPKLTKVPLLPILASAAARGSVTSMLMKQHRTHYPPLLISTLFVVTARDGVTSIWDREVVGSSPTGPNNGP
jgi:hypothetical protein